MTAIDLITQLNEINEFNDAIATPVYSNDGKDDALMRAFDWIESLLLIVMTTNSITQLNEINEFIDAIAAPVYINDGNDAAIVPVCKRCCYLHLY